jgi:hypothetical protein
MVHDAAKREIKWTVPEMRAGEMFAINFKVDLDGELIGKQGLTFDQRG